jgi:hypothetical protein
MVGTEPRTRLFSSAMRPVSIVVLESDIISVQDF